MLAVFVYYVNSTSHCARNLPVTMTAGLQLKERKASEMGWKENGF